MADLFDFLANGAGFLSGEGTQSQQGFKLRQQMAQDDLLTSALNRTVAQNALDRQMPLGMLRAKLQADIDEQKAEANRAEAAAESSRSESQRLADVYKSGQGQRDFTTNLFARMNKALAEGDASAAGPAAAAASALAEMQPGGGDALMDERGPAALFGLPAPTPDTALSDFLNNRIAGQVMARLGGAPITPNAGAVGQKGDALGDFVRMAQQTQQAQAQAAVRTLATKRDETFNDILQMLNDPILKGNQTMQQGIASMLAARGAQSTQALKGMDLDTLRQIRADIVMRQNLQRDFANGTIR